MFLTLLEYKCSWYGVNLVKIDRFAPSSKTCGKCGYVYKGLKLRERGWNLYVTVNYQSSFSFPTSPFFTASSILSIMTLE